LGKTDLRFDHFNVRNVPARIKAQKVDPWQAMPGVRQTVTVTMRKRVGSI
jgi:DNA primase